MVFGSGSWFIADAVNRKLDHASRCAFTAFVRESGGAKTPRPEDMHEAMFVRHADLYAAASGNLELLKWYHVNGSTCLGSGTQKLYDVAALNGRLDVIRWARENGRLWAVSSVVHAASRGHVHVLEWFAGDVMNDFRRQFFPEVLSLAEVCRTASRNGRLRVLQWADSLGRGWNADTCAEAARGGHLDVLRWARGKGCPWSEDTCAQAALGGHLHVLRWARAGGCPWNASTCSSAARNGHLDVLRWARCRGCPWDENTCSEAALGGHLDVVRWARAQGCPWNEDTCRNAVCHGHLEVLRWSRDNGCPMNRSRVVETAVIWGRTAVVLWASAEGYALSNESIFDLHFAARTGNLGLLEWLVDRGNKKPNETTVAHAAEGGSVDACRWLVDRGCPWDSRVGTAAAKAGHVPVVEWALGIGMAWTDEFWKAALSAHRHGVLLWAHRRGYTRPDAYVPPNDRPEDPASVFRHWQKTTLGFFFGGLS